IAELVDNMVVAQRAEQKGSDEDANDDDKPDPGFALLLDFDEDGEDDTRFATARSGASRAYGENQQGYQVYTSAYDREVQAASLVRPALLEEYRDRLDKGISEQGINV